MPDISIPGVKSRFDTDKTVESLMEIERIPRKRIEKSVETSQTQKTTWQDLGKRISDLRDGANQLFSYQNPFNDRSAASSDTSVLDVSATREARGGEYDFTVKQIAQADKLISKPLDKDYKVDAGNYTFKTGEGEVSFKFGGGTLRDFSDTLNRRASGKINAQALAIKSGTLSLVIGSNVTGKENKLVFEDDALKLAVSTGMAEQKNAEPVTINIKAAPASVEGQAVDTVIASTRGDSLKVAPMSKTSISMGNIKPSLGMMLKFETAVSRIGGIGNGAEGGAAVTEDESGQGVEEEAAAQTATEAGEGGARSASELSLVSIKFTDGTSVELPAISGGENWSQSTINLFDISGGKTPSSLEIKNTNARYDVSIKNIQALDPFPKAGTEPLNAISTAQDAIVLMDGIEIERPTNKIDDLIPGLTLNVKTASDVPVNVRVEQDNTSVKDAVINLVGNYNRLMAELNVLTRSDEQVLNELTYLKDDERDALRKKLGSLVNDSSILKLRSDLMSVVNSPYTTGTGEQTMLAAFGISTDARRAGTAGYDPSRLRGYLEIDEKAFDEALASNFDALHDVMGRDSDGDLVVDSGLAFSLVRTARPFVEVGGIISGKTQGLDTKIAADNRRISDLDRQLDRKESDLRRQYAQMEDAYNRMERMTGSLDNWAAQNNAQRR